MTESTIRNSSTFQQTFESSFEQRCRVEIQKCLKNLFKIGHCLSGDYFTKGRDLENDFLRDIVEDFYGSTASGEADVYLYVDEPQDWTLQKSESADDRLLRPLLSKRVGIFHWQMVTTSFLLTP